MGDPGQMIQYGLWKYEDGELAMFVRFFWEFAITTQTWDPTPLPDTINAQFSFDMNNGETDSEGKMTVSSFNCMLGSVDSNTYYPETGLYWPDSSVLLTDSMSQWPEGTPVQWRGGEQDDSGSWSIGEVTDGTYADTEAGYIMGDETFYAYACEGKRPLTAPDNGDFDIKGDTFYTYSATFQNWDGNYDVYGDKIQQSSTFKTPVVADQLFMTAEELEALVLDIVDSHAANFLTVSAIALGAVAGMLM